ncbi:MAG: hypothetical protein BalsKO_27220 [Balneolaceae bacterium]
MQELVNIFVKAIFVENMIFAYFLGMCSYLAVSKKVTTGVGLGLAVNICTNCYCTNKLSPSKFCFK